MLVPDRVDLAGIAAVLPRLWTVADRAAAALKKGGERSSDTPVFTVKGRYTSRGWTEWTQGFQFGIPLYLFEATGNRNWLEYGRRATVERMAVHVSHTGVHDHAFNNVSTYGNLLRFMNLGLIPEDPWERAFYELALKTSGAVQAARWTELPRGLGYIASFNGPHSLFADTIRTLRVLALAHQLGHRLMGEQDRRIDLLHRLLAHAETTARYNVYYGTGRDIWDEPGRVAHESIFNVSNGAYRCASSQQGYSPFSTWTRGHAWILLGFAELLEWLETRDESEFRGHGIEELSEDKPGILDRFVGVARATADYYLAETPSDGIPYWDDGAPGLGALGDWRSRPADPFNTHEPVDSSAAAIAAQGLLRLGRYLAGRGDADAGGRYERAGLSVAARLLSDDYLSLDADHQGVLLHAVYHRPNGWDYAPGADGVPRGESCLWGDYHLVELGIYLKRLSEGADELVFF